MTAVDTNIVVRLLTGDDARQAAQAAALFRSEDIWLSKSVILETEWVLRSSVPFSRRTDVRRDASAHEPAQSVG